MSIKLLFIIAFIFIIISLGTALFHLAKQKDPNHSVKTVNALTFRIGISFVLFILIFIAYATGIIKPEGIGARMQQVKQNQLQNKNPSNP